MQKFNIFCSWRKLLHNWQYKKSKNIWSSRARRAW